MFGKGQKNREKEELNALFFHNFTKQELPKWRKRQNQQNGSSQNGESNRKG